MDIKVGDKVRVKKKGYCFTKVGSEGVVLEVLSQDVVFVDFKKFTCVGEEPYTKEFTVKLSYLELIKDPIPEFRRITI